MIIETYQKIGGFHPETAAYTNVLASQGMVAPHTSQPFSEAMLMGIGGGLGMGYILWEFKRYSSALIVMGFRNRWNYPVEYLQNLSERIGVTAVVQETGSPNKATKNLLAALDSGQATIAWTDQGNMPYLYLPEQMDGVAGHVVAVCGYDSDNIWVDDRAAKLLPVSHEAFAKTRARIGSYKNRLMLLQPSGADVDLETAVLAGIRDCVEHLGRSSNSFAIPTLKKWAKLMTDSKNKKGWPVVFGRSGGRYGTLQYVYEQICLMGTQGSGLRTLYANFLTEAGTALNNDFMHDAAAAYREVATQWQALADTALSTDIAAFTEMRDLLHQKYSLFLQTGLEEEAQLRAITEEIYAKETQLNNDFPLDEAGTNTLYAAMQTQLMALHDAEKEALAVLTAVVA